jgi:hypothetical protein
MHGRQASNIVQTLFRKAWNTHCRQLGLVEYNYSTNPGFHVSDVHVKLGQKIPWGKQGERRSSMLRNIARGYAWQFGVGGLPGFWPFPDFKLKSRVLFSPIAGGEAGPPINDARKQHRLRRTVCKGWRNKQWHGRLMALMEVLSGDSPYVNLAVGGGVPIKLDAIPLPFTSPVSTYLPNKLSDEDEEDDPSTLGRPDPDEEP